MIYFTTVDTLSNKSQLKADICKDEQRAQLCNVAGILRAVSYTIVSITGLSFESHECNPQDSPVA
jgi:hypothetical protein